jgi:hypothetical protein
MRNEGAQSAVDPGWFSEKTRMRNEGAQSAVDPGWLSESARPRDTTGQPPGYIPQGTDGPDMNAPQIQKFKARQEAQKRLTAQNNASPPPTAKTAPEPAAEEPSGGALAALLNKFNKPRP